MICKLLGACSHRVLEPVPENKPNQLNQFIKQIKVKILNEDKVIVKTPYQNNKVEQTDDVQSELLASKVAQEF